MAVRRPNNHQQRRMCLEAADGLKAHTGTEDEALPEAIETVLRVLFTPVRDRYVAARKAYCGALAARFAAVRAVAEAEKAFDRTGREWNKGVTDEEGRHIPREFAKLFEGVLPGALFGLPYRKKVDLTQNLSERLKHFPHLVGDPQELANFLAAHTQLAEAVAHLEAAQRTHRACKAALDVATLQFDRKWMALVEVIEESSPTLASRFLPDFPSRSKKALRKAQTGVASQPDAAVPEDPGQFDAPPTEEAPAVPPACEPPQSRQERALAGRDPFPLTHPEPRAPQPPSFEVSGLDLEPRTPSPRPESPSFELESEPRAPEVGAPAHTGSRRQPDGSENSKSIDSPNSATMNF